MTSEIEHRSPAEIERLGFAALCERLGPADAIRFLQQFDLGRGDYTRERDHLFKGDTIDSLVDEVVQQRHGDDPQLAT